MKCGDFFRHIFIWKNQRDSLVARSLFFFTVLFSLSSSSYAVGTIAAFEEAALPFNFESDLGEGARCLTKDACSKGLSCELSFELNKDDNEQLQTCYSRLELGNLYHAKRCKEAEATDTECFSDPSNQNSVSQQRRDFEAQFNSLMSNTSFRVCKRSSTSLDFPSRFGLIACQTDGECESKVCAKSKKNGQKFCLPMATCQKSCRKESEEVDGSSQCCDNLYNLNGRCHPKDLIPSILIEAISLKETSDSNNQCLMREIIADLGQDTSDKGIRQNSKELTHKVKMTELFLTALEFFYADADQNLDDDYGFNAQLKSFFLEHRSKRLKIEAKHFKAIQKNRRELEELEKKVKNSSRRGRRGRSDNESNVDAVKKVTKIQIKRLEIDLEREVRMTELFRGDYIKLQELINDIKDPKYPYEFYGKKNYWAKLNDGASGPLATFYNSFNPEGVGAEIPFGENSFSVNKSFCEKRKEGNILTRPNKSCVKKCLPLGEDKIVDPLYRSDFLPDLENNLKTKGEAFVINQLKEKMKSYSKEFISLDKNEKSEKNEKEGKSKRRKRKSFKDLFKELIKKKIKKIKEKLRLRPKRRDRDRDNDRDNDRDRDRGSDRDRDRDRDRDDDDKEDEEDRRIIRQSRNESCSPQPSNSDLICDPTPDPVCGCNGTTYINSCQAKKKGISFVKGECGNIGLRRIRANEIQNSDILALATELKFENIPAIDSPDWFEFKEDVIYQFLSFNVFEFFKSYGRSQNCEYSGASTKGQSVIFLQGLMDQVQEYYGQHQEIYRDNLQCLSPNFGKKQSVGRASDSRSLNKLPGDSRPSFLEDGGDNPSVQGKIQARELNKKESDISNKQGINESLTNIGAGANILLPNGKNSRLNIKPGSGNGLGNGLAGNASNASRTQLIQTIRNNGKQVTRRIINDNQKRANTIGGNRTTTSSPSSSTSNTSSSGASPLSVASSPISPNPTNAGGDTENGITDEEENNVVKNKFFDLKRRNSEFLNSFNAEKDKDNQEATTSNGSTLGSLASVLGQNPLNQDKKSATDIFGSPTPQIAGAQQGKDLIGSKGKLLKEKSLKEERKRRRSSKQEIEEATSSAKGNSGNIAQGNEELLENPKEKTKEEILEELAKADKNSNKDEDDKDEEESALGAYNDNEDYTPWRLSASDKGSVSHIKLRRSELVHLLREIKNNPNSFRPSEEDNIFDTISKTFQRTAIPRLVSDDFIENLDRQE
jgi:hypothetical protein